jgi:UDP-N-acetylmuramoylalanine--D-glutamate ligase
MAFSAKTAAVLGLGKSGRSAAALLQTRGTRVTAFDEKPGEAPAGVECRFGPLPSEFWKGFDVIVVSPGIPLDRAELKAARAAGAHLIGEIELAFLCLPEGTGPILGITGTNGKSTTTALLGELWTQTGKPVFVGGNLGRPFTEACAQKYAMHVVELSSFQLEGIETAGFLGAAILNLTPDHLDRYASHDAYGAAKARIFKNSPKQPPFIPSAPSTPSHPPFTPSGVEGRASSVSRGPFAVVNADDFETVRLSRAAKVPTYAFTLDASRTNAGFSGLAVGDKTGFQLLFGELKAFEVRNRALRGDHNLQNAMAAAIMGRLSGLDDATIQRGLDAFPGLPHRLEFVRELDGVEWINDSKATNVDSSLVAMKALEGKVWLIAGGKGKGAPYAPLVEAARGKLVGVLTIGADAPAIAEAFRSSAAVHDCGTLEAAVTRARSFARKGETVLLSPACASYDQFNNFEHRGDTFKALVKAL